MCRNIMDEIGIERERLEMVMMSAGMGYRFAQVATEITEKIRKLGPSPIHAAINRQESDACVVIGIN